VPINPAHQRYLDVLFAQARATRYPSHQILRRIEMAVADRESAEQYVDLLLTEAENQRYPSLEMLDRANRMMAKLVVADVAERMEDELAQADD
jgi:hypothetical protein